LTTQLNKKWLISSNRDITVTNCFRVFLFFFFCSLRV